MRKLLLSTILLISFTSNVFAVEFPSGFTNWNYRVKCTIQNAVIDSTLTNYNAYLDLARLTSDFHDNVKAAGADVRVTDSDAETEIAFHIEYDAGSDDGGVKPIIGTVLASAGTDFYLYWGNAAASAYSEGDTYGKHNAYESAFIASHGLNEDPSGSAPQAIDGTSASHDFTSQGTMTSGDLVDARAYKGWDLDGSGDRAELSYHADYDFGASDTFSVEMIFQPDNSGTFEAIGAKMNDAGNFRGWEIDRTDVNEMAWHLIDTWPSKALSVKSDTGEFLTSWYHLIITYSGSATPAGVIIYKNGASITVNTRTNTLSVSDTTTYNTDILYASRLVSAAQWMPFDGIVEEYSFYDDVRIAAYAKARFNQFLNNSSFVSIGTVEENTGVPFTPKVIIY